MTYWKEIVRNFVIKTLTRRSLTLGSHLTTWNSQNLPLCKRYYCSWLHPSTRPVDVSVHRYRGPWLLVLRFLPYRTPLRKVSKGLIKCEKTHQPHVSPSYLHLGVKFLGSQSKEVSSQRFSLCSDICRNIVPGETRTLQSRRTPHIGPSSLHPPPRRVTPKET